ncbi:MAG: hypothetical protein LBU07_04615 [Coriobacteriales bacterium]|jgi:hypothetical protein|nr:hypothetical protein [Coriobacteriales bacterium]
MTRKEHCLTGAAIALVLVAVIGISALLLSRQGAQEQNPSDNSEPGLLSQGIPEESRVPISAERAGFVRQQEESTPPYNAPRETRIASLEPRVLLSDTDWTYLTDLDAKYHTDKPFIFIGTVTEIKNIEAPENYYEIPLMLTVSIDKVYSGDAFETGDVTTMFFPVSRYFNSKEQITQDGPVIEANKSYVFFANLPQEELIKKWLQERYPEYPGLADSVGLVINWDAYCFPIKEGLICVWMGN